MDCGVYARLTTRSDEAVACRLNRSDPAKAGLQLPYDCSECGSMKVVLASLIPGGLLFLAGLDGNGWTYLLFCALFYYLAWPLGLFLHLWSLAHGAAEYSQRPWLHR
jgi:hypothetical protein